MNMIQNTQHSPACRPGTDLSTIEQVARRTGLTKRTLRYYEEFGLLSPTDRTEGNYRRYSEDDIRRLEHIKELRELLGFSLLEIRELLAGEDEREDIKVAYKQEADPAIKISQLERADKLIQAQLQIVQRKIAGLQQMQAELQSRLARHADIRKNLDQP